MRRVYLDSCFLIYLMEETPGFSVAARRHFAKHAEATFCISPLVRLEVLTRPMRDGNAALTADYEDFLAAHCSLPITEAVFGQALELRVRHRLKTPDALHLATAQYHGCAEIWTNDDRLNGAAGTMAVNVLMGTQTSAVV
jgi:predicted nucleic acid-binding protein